jgi:hypothetical protein
MTDLVLSDDVLVKLAQVQALKACWALSPLSAFLEQQGCRSCRKAPTITPPATIMGLVRERLARDESTQTKIKTRYRADRLILR